MASSSKDAISAAILLEGCGYRWHRVGGHDYLLRRTDIDQKDTDVD